MALVHCPRPLVPCRFNAFDAPGGPREERPQVRLGQAPRVRPRVGVRITKTADVEPAAGPDDPGELRDVAPLHLVVEAVQQRRVQRDGEAADLLGQRVDRRVEEVRARRDLEARGPARVGDGLGERRRRGPLARGGDGRRRQVEADDGVAAAREVVRVVAGACAGAAR